MCRSIPPGARPLDDPQSHPGSFDANQKPPAEPPPSSGGAPPGVKEQFGATRDAFRRLAGSHVDLAKAEMSAIGGEIARAVGLGCLAVAILLFLGLLLVIGGALFLSEWLLGSMGWALLHGSLLFPALALAAVPAAIGIGGGRLAAWLGLALLIGLGIAIVLGLHLLNQAYSALGDAVIPGVDPAFRTIVAGMVTGAIVIGLLSLLPAIRIGGGFGVLVLIAGLVVGVALGAFTAITFDWQPAVGLGLSVAYLAWIGLMIVDVARSGVDTEALKNRFTPRVTIDTFKETLEWLKKRMPRGNES